MSLFKIASDVRLLASGPRCGLGELRLPALQPGSSIMPGKVNPVICESVTQVAAQVIGHDAAIAVAGLSGQLELNAFLPLIARNLLESIRLLANVSKLFVERCLEGLEVDRERAGALVEGSLALVTALVPAIGYDAAARIAKRCAETGKTVREVCLEQRVLPPRGARAPARSRARRPRRQARASQRSPCLREIPCSRRAAALRSGGMPSSSRISSSCAPSAGAALRTRSGVRESFAAGPVTGTPAPAGPLGVCSMSRASTAGSRAASA